MGNIVKNTDNRNGIINQITVVKKYSIRLKKMAKKTFRKKKYYHELEVLLESQLNKKIEAFKKNKKYIPNVFLELDQVKEDLRYVTQPILFYKKNINELKKIDFYFFNTVLEELGIEKQTLNIPTKLENPKSLIELNNYTGQVINILSEFKASVPKFEEIKKEMEETLSQEQYKLFIKEGTLHYRFERFINTFENAFLLLQKKLILLTETAGQGKTNLVCDFVENVMLKKGLLGVVFTGNEFNNLSRDKIEDVILKEVYGFEPDVCFNDFLDDLEFLCKKNNTTFTIVIDGLNENMNIENFSNELYSFIEMILKQEFIRLIFTCRSEYFDDRFTNFHEPSFKHDMIKHDNYMKRYRKPRNEFTKHLKDRLISSYFSFFQIKNIVSDSVKTKLANNFLLLRMFSEVYGERDNPNAPTEQVFNIYKDDLFKKYFDFKVKQINTTTNYTSQDLKKLFELILKYMIENQVYINIPLENIDNINQDLLEHIIGEDIFFRKDLVQDENSVYANSEVLNFTFDEFRDYLLSDFIVNTEGYDPKIFLESLTKGTTIFEGIKRYLFLKSRKEIYKEKLQFLEDLEDYDNLFLDNIFSIREDDITDEDINKIEDLFIKDLNFSIKIIDRLMYRHHTNHYERLNIFTLLEIITSLTLEQYAEFINPHFKITRDYYSRNRIGNFLELLEHLDDILKERIFKEEDALHNVFELMFLLLGITDESRYDDRPPMELTILLEDYIDKYPKNAQKTLLKYQDINNEKIKFEIWKLLNYYANKQIDFDKDFYQKTFKTQAELGDSNLKSHMLSFLQTCYQEDSSWCDDEEHKFFEILHEEEEAKRKAAREAIMELIHVN